MLPWSHTVLLHRIGCVELSVQFEAATIGRSTSVKRYRENSACRRNEHPQITAVGEVLDLQV